MDGFTATRELVQALEEASIPYLIVGSLSSSIYSLPRSTEGADIVVSLEPGSLENLMNQLGPDFTLDPHGSFETVTGTLRHILEIQGSSFTIELFLLSEDEHDQKRFERKRSIDLKPIGRSAYLPTPEDVIITKLRWIVGAKRSKDWEDVRNVISVQEEIGLDWDYIHSWCEKHGTRSTLEEIKASIPRGL